MVFLLFDLFGVWLTFVVVVIVFVFVLVWFVWGLVFGRFGFS